MIDVYVTAAIMAVIEAMTEFLPVSSTGHLLLAGHFLNFQGPPGRVFEVAIQLGAILAVCVLYFSRLWGVVVGMTRNDAPSWRFAIAVATGFLPAMVLGALLHEYIKNVLFNPWVVCVALIVGGFIILFLDKRLAQNARVHAVEEMPAITALKIGAFQCLALMPGVSRSGASILGGLALGLDRKTAAEFSFFLAIPTMFGAVAYDLFKNRDVLALDDMNLIAMGFAITFVVALLVVKAMIGFVSRYGYGLFAWYRIGLGSLCLFWLMMGL